MRVLLVHPSPLMYSELYLRLEPLGLERVAAAVRAAGHEVRLLDLQIFGHADYCARAGDVRARRRSGFSVNYLANVPEVIDLAKETKARAARGCFVFVGGHSASFIAAELLEHADGAIDCVVARRGRGHRPARAGGLARPEARHAARRGDPARARARARRCCDDLDTAPARARPRCASATSTSSACSIPCASVEFTRGCPWDCSFCSAWTFYGRSYRKGSPEAAAEDLARIREPNVFIVDDVAFIQAEHGFAIARGDRAPAHPQAVLPGDTLRRADQEPGAVRVLEAARALLHVPRASRPSTRRPSRCTASG